MGVGRVTRSEIAPAVLLMTAEEAEAACQRIDASLGDIDRDLLLIHAGEGWLALGFATFVDLVEQRLGGSRRNAFRRVARIEITATIEAAQPSSDARVTPKVSDRQAAAIAGDPAMLDGIVDVVSTGADPDEAVKAAVAAKPPPKARQKRRRFKKADDEKPEQMRLWYVDDSQKAMFASFDAVLGEFGPEKTAKLLATMAKRCHAASPKATTIADEDFAKLSPSNLVPVDCKHPKTVFNGNYHKCTTCGAVVPKKVGSR